MFKRLIDLILINSVLQEELNVICVDIIVEKKKVKLKEFGDKQNHNKT